MVTYILQEALPNFIFHQDIIVITSTTYLLNSTLNVLADNNHINIQVYLIK